MECMYLITLCMHVCFRKKKCQVRYAISKRREKSKRRQKTLQSHKRQGGYIQRIASLSRLLLLAFSPSPPLSPKKTKSNACRRRPLLLLLLLLRKNVKSMPPNNADAKNKRFKYIHNSLFQSLSLSPKKGAQCGFF